MLGFGAKFHLLAVKSFPFSTKKAKHFPDDIQVKEEKGDFLGEK